MASKKTFREGFEVGSSDNLPAVDTDMLNNFYVENIDFVSAEVKNVKNKRAGRESYGDNAIGFVQLKREGSICTVWAKITPEHKIQKKPYEVCAVINEQEEIVVSCKCLDCAASAGGCKHGIAFLLWLHRRSEEPSVTDTICYWKRSTLSKVDTSGKDLQQLVKGELPKVGPRDEAIVPEFVATVPGGIGGIFDIFNEPKHAFLSIHQLMMKYKNNGNSPVADDFIRFISDNVTDKLCDAAEKSTVFQAKSLEWYELRYGRITASKLYEIAKCKTPEGVLVETVLGASKPLLTDAVLRGQALEAEVLQEVAKIRHISVNNVGLFLNKKYPIFAASPDGLSSKYCIEIKCPSKDKTISNYIKNDIIAKKYFYQMQLQMCLCKRQFALFCIASPNFERTREVRIIEVPYDEDALSTVMEDAQNFWKTTVFPKLYT